MIKLKLEEGVEIPKYATDGSAGLDVIAFDIMKAYKGDKAVPEDRLQKMKDGFERGYIKIRPFERILFSTGLTLAELDENLELQVRARSGITLKQGLMVANSPGTIDSDYRGPIGVIIYNSTPFMTTINKGDRIAQLVPKTVIKPSIFAVEEVTETKRGKGGFGSTGTSDKI